VRHRLRDYLVYALGRGAIGVAAVLPQFCGYGLAALLGRLFFHCDRRRRRYALRLLRNAFPGRPDAELARLGAVATGNIFKVPVDMARLTRLLARGGDLRRVIDVSQAQPLLPGNGPYLALTAHLGSWEMAAAAMANIAHEAHGIARVFKNPLLQRWILANRQRGGLHIHSRRGGIQGLTAALGRGAVGLQVVDQNQRLRGVFAPFFGERASCERAAASLALRRGYPIVVGMALRSGFGFRFRLVAVPPFVPVPTGDKEADLQRTVGQINDRLEAFIRGTPEQYLWIHDRYRTQPLPRADQPRTQAAADGDD